MLSVLPSCGVPRGGLDAPNPRPELEVSPAYVCPGEPVTISWNLRLPRSQQNCRNPFGGYDALTPCEVLADCPRGADSCLDGHCSRCESLGRSAAIECSSPPARGCAPNLSFGLETTPEPLDPPVRDVRDPGRESGLVTINPEETTTVTLKGGYLDAQSGAGATYEEPPITVDVVVVDDELTVSPVAEFPCNSARSLDWATIRLEDLAASEGMAVSGIRNPNPFAVEIETAPGEWERLAPGGSTARFDGPVRGTVRSRIPAAEPVIAAAPRPECGPEVSRNPWPPIVLEVTLSCGG
jgi:hypothetical protein